MHTESCYCLSAFQITSSNGPLQCRGQAVDLTTEHRVTGSGPTVEAEVHRVEDVGGWIEDGRVCDVIAVSRAFGDREFKGDGAKSMLQRGVRYGPCSSDVQTWLCWERTCWHSSKFSRCSLP